MNDEELKREKRRRRRIRSQILAYCTLAMLIVAALGALYFGASGVVRYIKNYNNKVSEVIAEAESELEAEPEEETFTSESTQAAYDEKEYTPEPSADPLGELVTTLLEDMTLEEMVYGMFLVTPEALTGVQTVVQAGESTKNALLEKPVGGIVYSAKNLQSEEQFTQMLQNTKDFSKYPLFLVMDTPTSLSNVMTTQTLRESLDIDGVVITDALDAEAITENDTPEEAAVAAIEAGADMLYRPSDLEAAYNGVLEAVQDGRITKERIYESLYRIYRVKYKDTVL